LVNPTGQHGLASGSGTVTGQLMVHPLLPQVNRQSSGSNLQQSMRDDLALLAMAWQTNF